MLPELICRACHRDRRVRHCCVGPTELESEKKNVDQFWSKLLSANQKLGQKGTANQKLGEKGPANQKLGHWARLCQSIRNWARKYSMTLGPICPKMTSLYIRDNHLGQVGPSVMMHFLSQYESQSYWVRFTNQSDWSKSPNDPTLLIRVEYDPTLLISPLKTVTTCPSPVLVADLILI